MKYLINENDKKAIIKQIDNVIERVSLKSEKLSFLFNVKDDFSNFLRNLKSELSNNSETFDNLLRYLDYWTNIRIYIKFNPKILYFIQPISNLNLKIYDLIKKHPLIKESNTLLNGVNSKNLFITHEDRTHLGKIVESSTNKTHLEYLGYGRFSNHNSKISLGINRNYLVAGTHSNCPFHFIDFFHGKYHFYWHTHAVNIPFSDEDKCFSHNTGIPGILLLPNGELTLLVKGQVIYIVE